MQLSADLSLLIQAASHQAQNMTDMKTSEIAQKVISMLDYTTLSETDTIDSIEKFCLGSQTEFGPTAAVCVYPQFVLQARALLDDTSTSVATVINFPHGKDNAAQVALATRQAIMEGAQEIDIVLPYSAFLEGHKDLARSILRACKDQCRTEAKMKVILETGALQTAAQIREASFLSLEEGANFLKTSTGKIQTGATLEAAAIMMTAIKEFGNRRIGFKASGGIRTFQDAFTYLSLAERLMGSEWISAEHFRFGASGLLDSLITVIKEESADA